MSAWGGIDESGDSAVDAHGSEFDMEQVLALAATEPDAARLELQRALTEAAQNGNEALVHDILGSNEAARLVDVNAKDAAGSAPLIYSSCFGHEHVVAELLRFGADPNLQDQNEWTALMWAVNNNHLGIVKQLLAADADVSIKTGTGRTAFDLQMSSTSATYLYLKSHGYITSTGTGTDDLGTDLYEPAVDPSEVEAQFAENLKESAATLGFGAAVVDDDDDASDRGFRLDEPVSMPAVRKPEEQLAVDFDWSTFKVKDSLALPRDAVPRFLDLVITDMRPTLQKNQIPVSANALFLAARYFFFCGTEEGFTAMVSPIGRRIELAVQDPMHKGDLAYLSYWLANTQVLLYYLRRDAGLAQATRHDVQQTVDALTREISQHIQRHAEQLLLPLIGPCLLDYESIPEYGKVEYRDEWRLFRAASKHLSNDDDLVQRRMLPPSQATLIKNPGPQRVTAVLSSLLLLFQIYSVHPVTQLQIIAKLLYFVAARLFNTIVSSRKYLNRRRAMQIRLNVSILEDWCRNQNFRPDAVEVGNKTYEYKSLIGVGRTFLAPLVQILAWLQTFSGFGSDFTTVVSTLQELRALNPKQLLYTATHYRFETREAPLSKDYKHYLQELASHHSRASEQESAIPDASAAPPPPASLVDLNDSLATASPLSEAPSESCVYVGYELPVAEDVLIDTDLVLNEHGPLLDEGLQFWGGGFGFTQTHSGHFFVPYIPHDLIEVLSANGATDEQEVDQDERNLELEGPETAGRRPQSGNEPLEPESAWQLDNDDLADMAPVWN